MKYLTVTKEQRMVKHIKKSQTDGDVLLVSKNKDFEDIEMPIIRIVNLLQVRFIFKTKM